MKIAARAVFLTLAVLLNPPAFAQRGSTGNPQGFVSPREIDETTRCAIGRRGQCNLADAERRGLFETGLEPRFPGNTDCRGIDEAYAIDYGGKRGRESRHGGIDMPAPFGTPMLAVADGMVVAVFAGERSYRGMEIVLRHAPEDTGLPFWTYTEYAHCDALPSLEPGQRVKAGETVCPTGNSGIQGRRERRPAIHFAVFYSERPQYTIWRNVVVPADGYWMDPVAFYRTKGPYDSASMKALPDGEKVVNIPVVMDNGGRIPAGTKVIWPYACSER